MERFVANHEDAPHTCPSMRRWIGREFAQPPQVVCVRTRCVVPPQVEPFGALRRRNDKCNLEYPNQSDGLCAARQGDVLPQLCSTVLSVDARASSRPWSRAAPAPVLTKHAAQTTQSHGAREAGAAVAGVPLIL